MSQGTVRRKDNISKAIMLQMEHQLKPRWHTVAGSGQVVCNLVNFHTKKYMYRGEGHNHEEAFDAAYQDWQNATQAAEKVAVENESLRERLRDLEQQVAESSSSDNTETASEDSAPTEEPAPKRRRVKKSTPVETPEF